MTGETDYEHVYVVPNFQDFVSNGENNVDNIMSMAPMVFSLLFLKDPSFGILTCPNFLRVSPELRIIGIIS